jgi:hypothetical protein
MRGISSAACGCFEQVRLGNAAQEASMCLEIGPRWAWRINE